MSITPPTPPLDPSQETPAHQQAPLIPQPAKGVLEILLVVHVPGAKSSLELCQAGFSGVPGTMSSHYHASPIRLH